jgi:hypothetical protein
MVIITEKKSKQEAGDSSKWDITWKEALGVFKTLSGRRDITFHEVGPDKAVQKNNMTESIKCR